MTNKEMKNVFVLAMAIILLIVGIIETVSSMAEKYTVDQFCFNDGYKITVDWNKMEESEYSHDPFYYGCINNGTETIFWYTTATGWYTWIYDHIEDGHDHHEYLEQKTEWRW